MLNPVRFSPAWKARQRWLFAFAGVLAAAAFAAEDLTPFIEADPHDGLVTWWLVSPVQNTTLENAKPPLNAREGADVPGGKWLLNISDIRANELKPVLSAKEGIVWVSARIRCNTAGPRHIRVLSYCAVRAFKDGQPICDKKEPVQYVDDVETDVDFAQGVNEITLGVKLRQSFAGFQLTVTDGKGAGGPQKAAPGDTVVIPTVAGKPANAADAAIRALSLVSNEVFVEPKKLVRVKFGWHGSVPRGLDSLTGQLLEAGGNATGAEHPIGVYKPNGRDADVVKPSVDRATITMGYTIPETNSAALDLALQIKAGGKVIGAKKLALINSRGLLAEASALEKQIAERSAKAKRPLPNAQLSIDKLKLHLRDQGIVDPLEADPNDMPALPGDAPTTEFANELLKLLQIARKFADAEEAGNDPFANDVGYFERGYISKIDDSSQPYQLLVPRAYAANKNQKYPLVVFLHGYVPTYNKHRWWDSFDEFNGIFDQQNCFLALPFGRSNTDFQSCGEVDVLDVVAEMKRLYPIDDDRIYLYGYSMGGMAVYTITAHYPDVFAAAIAMAARADSPLQNFRMLDAFKPYKQWLIHADNPISLCENLTNLPLRIYHGTNDHTIRPDEAQRMSKRFAELNCSKAKLTMIPGDHMSGVNVMMDPEPVQWLLQQKRNNAPEKRRMKSYTLQYAKQGEVEVTAVNGAIEPIEVEWTAKDNAVTITRESKNILRKKVGGKFQPLAEPGFVKTPNLCGPVRQAICSPFMIVYGTTGSPEANAQNKKNALQFASEWLQFAKGRALVKSDKEVSDDDRKTRNLFLFGEQQENALHAQAAPKLPIALKNGSATVGDKTVPLTRRGAMFIYPSPFTEASAGRAIVVCCGVPHGKDIGVNHKLDLIPDFLIYGEDTDNDSTATNKPLCAGFFDGSWKLNPATTWWFE